MQIRWMVLSFYRINWTVNLLSVLLNYKLKNCYPITIFPRRITPVEPSPNATYKSEIWRWGRIPRKIAHIKTNLCWVCSLRNHLYFKKYMHEWGLSILNHSGYDCVYSKSIFLKFMANISQNDSLKSLKIDLEFESSFRFSGGLKTRSGLGSLLPAC